MVSAPLSTRPRRAGFALHDDEDDVYGGGDERFALTAFAGEDDGAGVRPGRLLAGTPAPGAGGRLRDAATRRPGTLAGFSRAAAVPPPPPPAALARPPRAWRGVHAFQTPPLASPWLAARSEQTGEVAADGVARRRTALEGKVPAPAPVASARPALGAPGAFEGLARAMGSRFATASASDATRPAAEPVLRGGLSAAPARPRAPSATAAPPARAEPASWAEPPTRLSNPWQPLPLLCKRFGIPVPRVVSDAAALRDRQFGGAPPPRVTTGATASKNFGAAVGAFLPGSDAAPAAPPPPGNAAPAEPPRAPETEFSSVFDRDDEDSPASARLAPAPPQPAPASREPPGDLFSALRSAPPPPRARRKEKRRSGQKKKKY